MPLSFGKLRTTSPSVDSFVPARQESRLDFPTPEGPVRARNSSGRRLKSRFRKSQRPSKRKPRPRAVSRGNTLSLVIRLRKFYPLNYGLSVFWTSSASRVTFRCSSGFTVTSSPLKTLSRNSGLSSFIPKRVCRMTSRSAAERLSR